MTSPYIQEKATYSRVSLSDSDLENNQLLSSQSKSPNHTEPSSQWTARRLVSHYLFYIHGLLAILWIVLFSALFLFTASPSCGSTPDSTSPLRTALSYSKLNFTSGFEPDLSIYQGVPNDKNNAAWDNITHLGMVALTEAEQTQLFEPTAVFKTNEENSGQGTLYLGAVEVFHQLHCLDMLRMEIHGVLDPWYKKHSPHNIETKPGHLEHCIDYIRQSMMCRPSLDILPFWTDEQDLWRPRFNGSRTCADFGAIKEWAATHKAGNLTPQ